LSDSIQSILQQVSLKLPVVRAKLGLLDKDFPKAPALSAEMVTHELHKVTPENLSPHELLVVSGAVQVNKVFALWRCYKFSHLFMLSLLTAVC